jgi:lipoate-protein ligase A
VGALPGGRILNGPGVDLTLGAFDVEPLRTAGRRVVLREVDRPLVVLGSTQPSSVVDAGRAHRHGVSVVRRRSGGGAVLLLPGAQIWADLWVPRGDPLWSDEARASAVVAGEWWARAFGTSTGMTVHTGPSVPAPGSDLVCFAGVGPGEVSWRGRKVVGLAQWRSREGALVHGCAYRRWDPGPLVELLSLDGDRRRSLGESLGTSAIGFDELEIAGAGASGSLDPDALLSALPPGPPWDVHRA